MYFSYPEHYTEIIHRYSWQRVDGFSYVDIARESGLEQYVDFSTIDSIINYLYNLIKCEIIATIF